MSLALSLSVGVLDGFGLAMFLPLLQMIDGASASGASEQMGGLSFLLTGLESIGLPLSLYTVLLIILFFFTFKGIAKFFEGYLRVIYQQFFIRKIRISNAEHLARFSYSAFVKADSGRIQNTFSGEVERVNRAYRTYFTGIQAAILVAVYVAMAFASNPQFTLLVAAGGLLTNVLFKSLYAATKRMSVAYTQQTHSFQGLLIQKVANFKYLKATGLVNQFVEKIKTSIENIERLQRKIGILSTTLEAMREPLTMLVIVAVILIQVEVLGGGLGAIILSLLFFYRALTYLMSMQGQWNGFLGVSGSLDNMTQFSEELIAGKENFGPKRFDRFKTEVRVENVHYAYGDEQVLKGVSCVIKKNKTVAIIGESGSGKTTLVNILSGLLEPSKGSLLIDGLAANMLDMRSFQRRIGYITQEPVIFSDTVFNNVTFWAEKNEENKARFYQALAQAAIYDFIQAQPLQEETLLGNNGINLSGGQRQRISIARELYKDVDFLIMDEATSALDSETERAIQDNIDDLKGKYTIIIIAHRLSTIRNADTILLLQQGEIVAAGDFNELLKHSSHFKKMVSLQEV